MILTSKKSNINELTSISRVLGGSLSKMIESLIKEWLSDCAELSPLELATYANNFTQDEEIVQALYLLFEERTKYTEVFYTKIKNN